MKTLVERLKQQTRRGRHARRLRQHVRHSDQLRLIIGASGTHFDGWIATEQHLVDLLEPLTWAEFFSKDSVDAILAEHVWEHLTLEQGRIAASTCFQFMKPGGHLRVAVPDGNHPSRSYIERVRPGGTGEGADDHKLLYDYRTFSDTFTKTGFDVCLIEYFDENGEFRSKPWDESKGMIHRSLRFDERNRTEKYGYTSLFLDAVKPRVLDSSNAA